VLGEENLPLSLSFLKRKEEEDEWSDFEYSFCQMANLCEHHAM